RNSSFALPGASVSGYLVSTAPSHSAMLCQGFFSFSVSFDLIPMVLRFTFRAESPWSKLPKYCIQCSQDPDDDDETDDESGRTAEHALVNFNDPGSILTAAIGQTDQDHGSDQYYKYNGHPVQERIIGKIAVGPDR